MTKVIMYTERTISVSEARTCGREDGEQMAAERAAELANELDAAAIVEQMETNGWTGPRAGKDDPAAAAYSAGVRLNTTAKQKAYNAAFWKAARKVLNSL